MSSRTRRRSLGRSKSRRQQASRRLSLTHRQLAERHLSDTSKRSDVTFTNITTAGAGTMGSQVAWQMAFNGKHVTVYDAVPAGLARGERSTGSTPSTSSRAAAQLPTDRPDVRSADLHHRSGDRSARRRSDQRIGTGIDRDQGSLLARASRHAPPHTVFTTNTSTLAPSALASFVDRPQQFLALHFAIGVWDANIGEVMGHPGTDPAVFSQVLPSPPRSVWCRSPSTRSRAGTSSTACSCRGAPPRSTFWFVA